MPEYLKNQWLEVTLDNQELVTLYLEELKKIREHYQQRGMDDVDHWLEDKPDVKCYMYFGQDGESEFTLGVLLHYKNGTERYRLANAFVSGDVAIEEAIAMWADRCDVYCIEHDADGYEVLIPKDMIGKMAAVDKTKVMLVVNSRYVITPIVDDQHVTFVYLTRK